MASVVASAPEPRATARAAGLRYVTDASPGIRRRKAGKGFRYVGPDGKAVRDPEALARIRRLAIPPAWTEVWVCPDPQGHLQATGRDARGRKQYRYHPRWRAVRDEAKYGRTIAFAEALPAIRARVERDLRRPGLPREKVLATVVRLLETTLVRVGNPEYARQNGSYGLTTLRDRHADVRGARVRLRFRGKAGKAHEVELEDPAVARVVRRARDIPGEELFQYVDDAGQARPVTSGDVNDYLRETTGQDFTAKDFRTWAGTVLAALALKETRREAGATRRRRQVVRAIEAVAQRLGNTPTICRKCYVHPDVIEAHLDGTLLDALAEQVRDAAAEGLDADERAVLALLKRRLGSPSPPGPRRPPRASPTRRRRPPRRAT